MFNRTGKMLDLLASITIGMQDSFAPTKSPSIVVVLASPVETRNQQRLLVNCEITKTSTDYLEITCAD
jgi:hypothetical protein